MDPRSPRLQPGKSFFSSKKFAPGRGRSNSLTGDGPNAGTTRQRSMTQNEVAKLMPRKGSQEPPPKQKWSMFRRKRTNENNDNLRGSNASAKGSANTSARKGSNSEYEGLSYEDYGLPGERERGHTRIHSDKLKTLEKRFSGGVKLAVEGRSFVLDGFLRKINSNGLIKRLYFLLLSDALLYCDRTSKGFVLRKELPLCGATCIAIASNPKRFVFHSSKRIVVECATEELRDQWLQTILAIIPSLNQTGRTSQTSLQAAALYGTFVKFTRNKSDKHQRFFQLGYDGSLSWADKPSNLLSKAKSGKAKSKERSVMVRGIHTWRDEDDFKFREEFDMTEAEKLRCMFVTTTTKKLVLIAPTVTEMEKWTKWWGEKGPLRDDPRPSFTTDRLPSSPSSSIGQAGGAAAVQHMRTPSNDRRLSTLEKLRGYAGPAQEPFELLPLLLKGELNGASPVCLKHIAKCSEDHLICVLPLLACVLFETPFWLSAQALKLVGALSQRAAASVAVQQAVYCIKSSRLLDGQKEFDVKEGFRHWVRSLPVSRGIVQTFGSLAGAKECRSKGFCIAVDKEQRVMHPFSAGATLQALVVRHVFNSNCRPLLLTALCSGKQPKSPKSCKTKAAKQASKDASSGAAEREWLAKPGVFRHWCDIILKTKDDLRQDVSCMQVFRLMNVLWGSERLALQGYPVEILCYGVVAVSPELGLVEFVPGTLPIKSIRTLFSPVPAPGASGADGAEDGSLTGKAGREKDLNYQGPRVGPDKLLRMVSSAAGSFIGAYVLGIKDRHHDNILVKEDDGTVFHIDFGHILGDSVTLDTAAFAVTPDFKTCLGDEYWAVFVDLCVEAWAVLRKHSSFLIPFATMMLAPYIPREEVTRMLYKTMMADLDAGAAAYRLRSIIEKSHTNLKTKFKNIVHSVATDGVLKL